MKISTKLSLGFGAMALLILLLGAFALSSIFSIEAVVTSQNAIRQEKLEPLYSAREALDQTGIAARNAYLFDDEADALRELDLLDQQKAVYLDALRAMTPAFKGQADFEKAKQGLLAMAEELKRPRKYRSEGRMDEYATFLVRECSPLRRRIVADIDVVLRSVQSKADAQSQAAAVTVRQSVPAIVTVAALALLLAAVVGTLITRGLLRQLGGEPAEVASIARRVAQGDLAVTVATRSADRTSVMAAMKEMRESLAGIVTQVRSGTETIAAASADMSAGNSYLASRTAQQAASLEETSSSMAKLTGTVIRNARSAQEGNEIAIAASEVAVRGGAVMSEVVGTMQSINDSSARIADIVSLIDGIAFQTNLLALNAAVEAARAGEQGKGFAVVATEVRNLAQKSAAAAREIKVLIEDSVTRIGAGSRLVTEAGATMEEIVDSVKRVTAIMGEIRLASREQSAGIEQVGKAIGQMDAVTRQNAALVEQAAAGAASLREQAAALSEAASVFRLDPAAGAGTPAPPGARQIGAA